MSRFYKIFFSVVAVFLVLLIASAAFLVVVLEDYETNLASSVAQKYFDEQIKTFKLEGFRGTEFESAEQIADACKEKFATAELSLLTAAASGDGAHKYIVKSGDQRIVEFSVVPSGEKSKFGFSIYKIGEIDFLFGEKKVVRAPADCTVYINGKPLSDLHRGEEAQTEEMDMPQGISMIPMYTYTLPEIYSTPEIVAIGKDEAARQVTYNEQAGNYEVDQGYSEALKQQFGSLAVEAAKTYAAYMQNDAKLSDVAKYFQKSTKTYENIRTSEVYWVWAHDSFDFSDDWCGEFKQLADGVFICRVKMTQTLYLTNNAPYKDYIDVTICFAKQAGGNYLVYSLKSNG